MSATMEGRRHFFRATLGRLLDEVRTRAERRVAPTRYIRPPGALPEIAFLAACTRCADCIAACPPGALAPAPVEAGLAARTPILDPRRQPCIVCDDMPCVAACPTEALVQPEGGWDGVKLGWLELVPERCIAFQDVTCGVCVRACPVGERALKLDAKGRPVIVPEGCVGCGACERACVTAPSSIVLHPLEGA